MTMGLATILAVLSFTGCGFDPDNVPKISLDELEETTEEVRPVFRLSDLPPVDRTESFGVYEVDKVNEPWGSQQDLKMSDGFINTYFSYYSLDYYNNRVNEDLNNISVISRPTVTCYDADREGYVVYEVLYTQTFPICSKEPSSVSRSFFSYHNVGYVDYYTGTTFPVINLSSQIDSFGVTGTVVYEGKSYDVGYYEYRTDEVLSQSSEAVSGDSVVIRSNIQISSVVYFVVPEGYDGIFMYAYIADDTDTPIDEVLADDSPYYEPPAIFGDDEAVDDHVFIGINAPK